MHHLIDWDVTITLGILHYSSDKAFTFYKEERYKSHDLVQSYSANIKRVISQLELSELTMKKGKAKKLLESFNSNLSHVANPLFRTSG